jgi:RNA polymerase sigma-70 factor, ECF subfamily
MSREDGFGDLMTRLRGGDEEAATQVFRRFVHRLVALACGQFREREVFRADPEGLVQSAFGSFFARYERGQFVFDDWDELWGLLVVITLRKCGRQRDTLRALRRDAGREIPWLFAGDAGSAYEAVDQGPSPAEAAALADLVAHLLDRMGSQERTVVELTLQGYTTMEVAARLERTERTVWRVREGLRERLHSWLGAEGEA